MDICSTFSLFLQKQLMVLRFHYKSLGIIVAVCFGLQYLLLYFMYQPIQPLTEFVSPTSPDTLLNGCFFDVDQTFFAPETPEVINFMEQKCGSAVEMKGFAHVEAMVKTVEECKENCVGVHFRFPQKSEGGNKTLEYIIYTNRVRLSPKERYVTDSVDGSFSQSRDYMSFIKLQHSIDLDYITQLTNEQPDVTVQIGSMPHMRGGFFQNEAGITFGLLFPIFFVVILDSTFFVPLVEEKQDGLKEFLVIATPLSYLNGIAFYVVRLFIYVIYSICVLIVAANYNAMGIIPAFCAFILIFLFMLAIMSYTYLISVFFNTVFYAKTLGYLLLFLPMAFRFITSSIRKADVYLFSMNAFIEAWNSFQIMGNKYEKFDISLMFQKVTACSFTTFHVCMILLVQSIVYSLLYVYLVNIFPGPGGIRKPYLFFMDSTFWKNPECNECVTSDNSSDAIVIENLQKQFKTNSRKICIADNLNMTIRNRQITVLLGHNGAGKTTTINMIMGLVSKDGGKISVCSERDASYYRHLIGYCPQNSIFMQYMTCKQHLVFFAKLRGLGHQDANVLSNKLLQQLNLQEKAHEYGKNLSGGMKRRLSLGIAIAGDTRIVVLDEPSSGLDIQSRRELWDVLLELRKTKAILITTHHMEEAEVLGDTISILSNGRLQLTGSPLELKHTIGSGYVLKLCMNPSQYNENECLEIIRSYVPSAVVMNVVPPTVTISLPYAYKENYSKMLKHLEGQHLQLGINTISITDTTLEDVFLNSAPKEIGDEVDGAVNCRGDTTIRVPYQRLDSLKNVNFWQQFMAIAYKKLLFLINEWILSLFLISTPFVLTTIAIVIIHSSTTLEFGTGLHLSLDHYKNGIIYINVAPDTSVEINTYAAIFKNQIEKYPGLAVKELSLNESVNIDEELIEIMRKDFYNFQQEAIGTIQLGGEKTPTITILYSVNMIHSSAILTNLVDNSIYMWSTNSNENILKTIYAPVAVHNSSAGSLRLAYYATLVPMGLFMLMFYFAMLPFKENRSGFKRLHATSSCIYWGSNLIFDLLLLFLICMALFAYQSLIMPHELYNMEDLCSIVFSIFFYGLSYLPLIYCLTNIATTMSALSTCLVTLYNISLIPTFIVSTSVGDMIKYENYITFLRLLPDFNLCHQLRIINELFINSRAEHIPEEIRNELNSKSFLHLSTFYFYALLVFPILMSVFILVVENNHRRQKISGSCKIGNFRTKPDNTTHHQEEDRFIQEEKSTVEKIIRDNVQNEYPLVVQNVCKIYNQKVAVSDLNFVVRKQECFGLLGVNGAGKTTTFEMIAANRIITAGTIKIDGVDIFKNEAEYRYRFGYCPQNDCLNDFMTAYQTLQYMALLRGIQKQYVHEEVKYWLEKLDLTDFENVQVRHYSGGTKRKLQTATAMIGSPSLVLLDEPTTGVDPISRRFLWKSIQDFQKRDKTIVLTSHSMDECENLCNRLAIMAEGQFKCLGHVPELKQLYGAGFTISIKLRTSEATDNEVQAVTHQLKQIFPHSKLRENHAGILTYFIKAHDIIVWSEVFSKCAQFQQKAADLIEEYSVNETTLEDIFLKYDTKQKRNSTNGQIHTCDSIELDS
ncbi:ATP-binding cassette sub-family A member 2 [Stomoxys calcitrans]|uniref:ATP-binding cassette sub-family A member 2 n=1 Tax=Stomoxys calcitrans TaxID=35570 RepID=UPI0027E2D583|nr:ATP-binding cassette sub-family A member 2 [Stomoxys calcitrans]